MDGVCVWRRLVPVLGTVVRGLQCLLGEFGTTEANTDVPCLNHGTTNFATSLQHILCNNIIL